MGLEDTLAFVAVVDAGSFSAAARRLGVPKSTLSRQVARLEDRLGARLLQRTTRKVSSTDIGRAFYERCGPAIEELQNAERMAQDTSGPPKGKLKVSCPFDLARDELIHTIPEWRQRYPEIELELFLSQQRVDLVADKFDVALRGGSFPDSSFISRKIFGSEMLLCASPDYLDRAGRPQHPDELLGHESVSMPFPGQSLPFEGPDGPTQIKLQPWFVANEWGVLRTLQLAGLGLGPQIIQHVADDLAQGHLERVLPDYNRTDGGLYAVYPSRHHLSRKVRVFVDFLVEMLPPRLEH